MSEIEMLEDEVRAARARFARAAERLALDAAPAAVGSSAATYGLMWARETGGEKLVAVLRERPLLSVVLLLGGIAVLSRLGEGPRHVSPPPPPGRRPLPR